MDTAGEQIRPALWLLESWLPLAQQLNQANNWRADPAELEALVLAAAPALAQVRSAAEARALLLISYAKLRSRQL